MTRRRGDPRKLARDAARYERRKVERKTINPERSYNVQDLLSLNIEELVTVCSQLNINCLGMTRLRMVHAIRTELMSLGLFAPVLNKSVPEPEPVDVKDAEESFADHIIRMIERGALDDEIYRIAKACVERRKEIE